MENSTTCPVCGKVGIPDYHQGEVRCPSCGSNLEVFRLLDAVEEENNAKSSKWKPIAIGAAVLACLFAMLYFTKGSSAGADAQELARLRDSIAILHEHIGGAAKQPAAAAADSKPATAAAAESTADSKPAEAPKTDGKDEKAAEETITAPAGMVTVKDGKKYYTVKKGDSWWKISQKLYKGKIKDVELARMNGRKATDQLEIDETLIVK